MRILFVTQIIPFPPHGGVLQRGFNLLRELGRRHEVHLMAFHHPDELAPGRPLQESRKVLSAFCATVEYFELWPKKSRLHTLAGLAAGAVYSAPFSVLAQRSSALAEGIRASCSSGARPEILHLDTIALAQYRSCGAGVPAVLAHHNIESQLMYRRSEREKGTFQRKYVERQARLLEKYEASTCGDFSLNITVSDGDALLLRQICPGIDTCVVPNGVDTEYFQPHLGGERLDLVFTGGMNMFANRDAMEWFLQQVWPLIKRRTPEARMIIIGQQPSATVCRIAEMDSEVKVLGHVPDVRPWVAGAAVYVVPMRVGGGTRLKIVDAMAQGKAIVSTTLGMEGIEAVEGVQALIADSPSDFAGRVVELLESRKDRCLLGAAARRLAEERYAWHGIGQRLCEAYESVAQENRP